MFEYSDSTTSVIDIRKNKLRSELLKELYRCNSTSINKLAKMFHTSIPSATSLVNELIREGWIVEKGIGVAKAGRPPVLYGLNNGKKYTIVADINRASITLNLLNLSNNLIRSEEKELPLVNHTSYTDELVAFIDSFIESLGIDRSIVWGIGVSMPGLISTSSGINHTYLNLTPAGETLKRHLESRTKTCVTIINDTRATTLGEHRFGLASQSRNVLTVNIDWGVGLGILINGEVFGGASGFAGELGHVQVRPDGILCDCGKVGCLDTITSATALLRQAQEGMEKGKATVLSKMTDRKPENLKNSHIIDAVNQGDQFSIDLLSALGTELGKGLATAVHLFNPECIIVTGILAQAGSFISNPIEQSINRYCLSDFKNQLKIRISELGAKSRLLGVQAYLFDHLSQVEYAD